jgi:periplasmic copper chaperone A
MTAVVSFTISPLGQAPISAFRSLMGAGMETLYMTKFTTQTCLRGAPLTLAVVTLQVAAAGLIVAPAAAADYDVGSMHISTPWARATPKGAAAGAGYMTITNKGTTPDTVSCVSDDASAQCQIHSVTMEGGVMKMRPVDSGLEIKPGETITLQPGGYHIMFVNLKHPLEQGESVKATLKFEHAGTIDVEYPIAAIGAPVPGAAAGGGTMMQGGGGGMMMQGHGMQGPAGGSMQMNKQ